jgi:hypothetical protein
MYQVGQASVRKAIESWKLIVPLHDNNGVEFDEKLIESIKNGIVSNYPGLTSISCVGQWKDGNQVYKDRNLELIIDAAPIAPNETEAFFTRYKVELQKQLNQSKIYLVRETNKSEVITFDEFFGEVGLVVDPNLEENDKRRIASDACANVDVLIRRMGYETTALKRDRELGVIIWERYIAGFKLRTEIHDDFPLDATIVAADRIDHHADALVKLNNTIVVGDWEYQSFILSRVPFTPFVPVNVPESSQASRFLNQKSEPISVQRFIEEMTMLVMCGIMALRDEGFFPADISLTVGSDGAMQWTKGDRGNIVFYNPAQITDRNVQQEIIRCLKVAIADLEQGNCPRAAIQQAKAMHKYIFKRGAIRAALRNRA